jgi:hypothetical protein
MMRILDACAVIAYLRNEEGADVVENALIKRVGDVYDFMLFFKSFNIFPIKA